jgi:hypothetical protein
MLRSVADESSTGQSQINASARLRERSQHEHSPIPPVKSGEAVPHPGNQLQRSRNTDHRSEKNVPGKGGIAHRFAGLVPIGKDFIPRLKIPAQRRKSIEGRYGQRERELPEECHHKPKSRSRSQRFVRNRIQLQPGSPDCRAHDRFSFRDR